MKVVWALRKIANKNFFFFFGENKDVGEYVYEEWDGLEVECTLQFVLVAMNNNFNSL